MGAKRVGSAYKASGRELPQVIEDLGKGRFQYIDFAEAEVLHRCETADGDLYVIGNEGNAAYEWVAVANGRVSQHSNAGYGVLITALRDGLNFVLGEQ